MTAGSHRTPTGPRSGGVVRLDLCGDPAELLVGFLNTLDVDSGTDELGSVATWLDWLDRVGLAARFPAAEQDLTAARELRRDLLRLAEHGECAEVHEVGVQVTLLPAGEVTLGAQAPSGLMAAAAATLAIEGRLDRVKICPADDCREAFYDESRNHSRQWCSMQVCGNRAKSRAHRERARPAARTSG